MPLWEAVLGGHEPVIKLLLDSGANLHHGDIGQFACTAAEQNNLAWLKEIIRYGGDVTIPKTNGTTALHVAVCEGNIKIVQFLLRQAADIDKPDSDGWTPRDLADQQGHEDIKILFQSAKEPRTQSIVAFPERKNGTRFLGRFTSEPAIRASSQEGSFTGTTDGSWSQPRPRRRTNKFHNSLSSMMSSAHNGEKDILFSVNMMRNGRDCGESGANPARVTISCPEKGEVAGKLMLLPGSFQELLEMGAKKFGVSPSKVLSKDGAEIDDIEVIRDGDHLILVSYIGIEESNS